MIKILFICHGNICRSPMAEFVLKDMVRRAGLAAQFEIASAATSSEELGNPVYPPARRLLAQHGLDCTGKTARRITRADYDEYDILIGMDRENMRNMLRVFGGDSEGKLRTMLSFAGRPDDSVADPWYTRDFEATWNDVCEGCIGLLNLLCPDVTLDFSGCTERRELYDIMREKMLWQEFYGSNLDALTDVLTALPYYGRRFSVILPPESSPVYEYAKRICAVFSECGKDVRIK